MINHVILGWLSFLCFALGCSYSLFKRNKKIRNITKMPIRKLLDFHCVFSIIATFLAFIHMQQNIINFRFSTGYVSLFLMIIITIIGVIMKYFKSIYMKYRIFLLYTHITLSVILVVTLLLHIIEYILLSSF